MNTRLNSALVLFATVATLMSVRPAQAQGYIGDAYGLNLNLIGLGLLSAGDTGFLPSTGGSLTGNVASANIGASGGLLNLNIGATTGVINTSTVGASNVVNSSALVNNLSVAPSLLETGLQLSANTISSSATANSSGTSGTATVTGLMFGNVAINVTGAANQTVVDALGNTLVINEQIHNANGSLTVNALDLSVLGSVVKLRVASSTAGFPAATPEPGSTALFTGALLSGGIFTVRRRRKTTGKIAVK